MFHWRAFTTDRGATCMSREPGAWAPRDSSPMARNGGCGLGRISTVVPAELPVVIPSPWGEESRGGHALTRALTKAQRPSTRFPWHTLSLYRFGHRLKPRGNGVPDVASILKLALRRARARFLEAGFSCTMWCFA